MIVQTVIATDLITPLGAYLRLREAGSASFLLESVEKGRLGRHSFVGAGSRLVSFEEAETCGAPVVGYLSYDYAAKLEPTVQLPDAGRDLPESRFVVADTLVRFDHARGMAEVLCGSPDEVTDLLAGAMPELPTGDGSAGQTRRFPPPSTTSRRSAARSATFGRATRSRSCSRSGPSAPSASALDLYRSLRRVNPSPYLFLLELDGLALIGSSPETLVKAEGRDASLNPIAGTTHPGDGDAERLLTSEKDRAEHVMLVDLGRNDLSRVCTPGSVRVRRFLEPERFSHVTHLVRGRRAAARRCGSLRPAPCLLPGRDRFRRAEGPRDAADLGARGLPARPVRRRRRLRAAGRGARHVHRDPDDRAARRRRVPPGGAGIVADSDPKLEQEECRQKLAALETAIRLAEAAVMLLVDNYDSFTFNLAHLFGELGVEVVVRRNDELDADEAERLAPSTSWSHPVRRPDASGATPQSSPASRGRPDARRLPRAPGDRRGVRRGDRRGARARPRQGDDGAARRRRALPRAPAGFEAGRYHSLAATGSPTSWRSARPHRTARSWRSGTGRCPSWPSIPPGVRADAGGADLARSFLETA